MTCFACELISGARELPGGRIHATQNWVIEHCAGPSQQTALHAAAGLRYTQDATDSARVLLDAGADVDALDAEGRTPLDIAEAGARSASAGPRRYDRMIELLRAHGAR